MKSLPDDMDLWMERAFNSWADQGDLPIDKSSHLHEIIAQLAYQNRKRRLTRASYGLAAIIMVCIWLLFASCPVAAADYMTSPIYQAQFTLSQALGLAAVIIYLFLNHLFQSQISKFFEVNYE